MLRDIAIQALRNSIRRKEEMIRELKEVEQTEKEQLELLESEQS